MKRSSQFNDQHGGGSAGRNVDDQIEDSHAKRFRSPREFPSGLSTDDQVSWFHRLQHQQDSLPSLPFDERAAGADGSYAALAAAHPRPSPRELRQAIPFHPSGGIEESKFPPAQDFHHLRQPVQQHTLNTQQFQSFQPQQHHLQNDQQRQQQQEQSSAGPQQAFVQQFPSHQHPLDQQPSQGQTMADLLQRYQEGGGASATSNRGPMGYNAQSFPFRDTPYPNPISMQGSANLTSDTTLLDDRFYQDSIREPYMNHPGSDSFRAALFDAQQQQYRPHGGMHANHSIMSSAPLPQPPVSSSHWASDGVSDASMDLPAITTNYPLILGASSSFAPAPRPNFDAASSGRSNFYDSSLASTTGATVPMNSAIGSPNRYLSKESMMFGAPPHILPTNTAPRLDRSHSFGGGVGHVDASPRTHPGLIASPRKLTATKGATAAAVVEGSYDPGKVKALSLPSDKGNLSEYQCLLREQIVLFAVTNNDIQCSAQGRNRPITLGQVGVLCRHCARIPPGMRPSGAVYFPAKLSGLYQASQNMAINHFSKSCQSIPEATRTRLFKLKERKSTVLGGGKHFWANGARVIGVVEHDLQLRFRDDA